MTDKRKNYPDWSHYLKNELPMVISWALDVVCSIWSLLYITLLSLYMNTITTSTSVFFILMFATAFGLMEQWNDIAQIFLAIVPLFTSRLLLFTFESKESNAEGFALALFTSGLIGVRWTIAQILAQKQESAQQALEEIQQLKDENGRLKLEKCQLEKEKHDVQEERDELVVQKNSLQADLRAKEAEVHRLQTSAQSVEGWSEQNPAVGTCDGTYGNKQYFKCDPDSDDWVDYSELTTLSKSPKRDNHGQGYIKSILDSVFPSFFKGNSDLRFPQPRHFDSLKIDQRVVTFHDEGIPLRGTVRYTGDVEDSSGHVQSVVGLELDERHGSGTGKWKGHQLFACRRDHACFVDIESIMLEEDFDKDAERAKKKATSQKQDKKLIDLKMQERRLIDKEIPTRSLSDNVQREASDRVCIGTVRRSNSFDLAVIVAAGESSKTDTRKFIEKQQQLLDDIKKCPTSDEDVAMKDDGRTASTDEQFEENASSRQSTSLDSTSLQQGLEDLQQLKNQYDRLKFEKCQLEKEKNDVQEENDELVVQNNSLQTNLRAKEAQVHDLETSLTTAQQTVEDMQQLKDEHNRLKLQKGQLEKEKYELVFQNNSLQTYLRAKEARLHELETFLTTAQQALMEMQQLKIDHNRLKLKKCQLEREKNDVQEGKDELVVQNNSLQTDLRAKEAQVRRLESSLTTAQRALEECQQIKEPCDWVVSRDEVQITDRCLGVGGWGKVSLGSFRDCKVAVKEIHELILSPYNRRLFEREMNIASRCRHPCLLQFIGATNDDGIPLFITELLDTSLRALLEQRQLADTEISIISLDVSLALNYLHNMKPSPILHRDVSSANVLLWRQGDQWRGKVSDYGTAKFVQQTMTRAPGAPNYSAPEAVSSHQTPKVDVYSCGVLLCEMCIREMPDPQRRHQQVLRVKSHVLRDLVSECVVANPAKRPEMSEIIKEIKRFEG
ncbi:probable serine/threonine-protein kinase drkD isoform X3 [Acropora muricata]